MAQELKEIHDKIKLIKDYLIKIGPSRRSTKIKSEKLSEAEVLYSKFNILYETINTQIASKEIKSADISQIEKLCNQIKSFYLKILDLCETIDQESNMEVFNLKTALSLIPVMTDDEKAIKQIISNVEYYNSMLDSNGSQALIKFVLKSRLSESAKLRLCANYASVTDLIKDMREHLLPKKSDTTIQQQLQRARQDASSIEEFGKQIEQLFVDLTITQANGDEKTFAILKPINEKNAIRRFTDGLRSSRISTIVAARNYSSLKDAIRGALDEELSLVPEGQLMNFQHSSRGKFENRNRGFLYNRGSYRGYQRDKSSYSATNSERGNSRGFRNNWRNNRGRSFADRNFRGQNNRQQLHVTQVDNNSEQETNSQGEAQLHDDVSHNLFFRA